VGTTHRLRLIAVTGLRINEALKLNDNDVDLHTAVLTVKTGKTRRLRYIPITESTVDQLLLYRTVRDRFLGHSSSNFFLQENGTCPTDCTARYNFALVCQRLGLRKPQKFYKYGTGPRIHDLRHTFAVRTIINWYKKGLNADDEMMKLSTYLGHLNPMHTYWYIEAVPELLQLASERSSRNFAGEKI